MNTNFETKPSNFLVKSGVVLGLTLALADLSTLLLYGNKDADLLSAIKLFCFDFGIAGVLMILLALPYFVLSKLHVKVAQSFVAILGFIIVLVSLLLNKYYATSKLSLGSDLYGYSLSDIKMIVSTSSDVSFVSLWPVYTFILIFIIAYRFLTIRGNFTYWLGGLLVAAMVFVGSDAFSKKPTQSNLTFFLKDSYEYFDSNKKSENVTLDTANPYPLMRDNSKPVDVLGKYLNLKTEKPNIVMIVVEGLGRDFSGDDAEYPGFTPFLDSLSNQSLTWTNFMSNAGRSFGALPSILGSLPFGKNGFLDMENLPDHISLISQLKKSNYKTSYFEGGDADFDHKLKYLESEGMENIVDDNSYSSEYVKTPSNEGFSWGYPDSEIFRKTLSELKPLTQPRFDMVLTISNHEPFIFNGKDKYMVKVDEMLSKSPMTSGKKETLSKYKDVLAALLYTDNSIREFITKYKASPNYENTIFIITGDHRLIPVPQKDEICRFHVPLIIHSPMQTKPEKFKGICSHMDIMPSILALINNKYAEKNIDTVPWIGTGLSDATSFTNDHNIPLTRYKGAIKDFVSGNMYLSDNVLFRIDEKFTITEERDSDEHDKMRQKISQFQKINNYVTQNNKIIPAKLAIQKTNVKVFTKEQQEVIDKHLKGRIDEDLFMIAREVAFKKQYKDALLLCDYVLKDSPNHFDARTLKGRIYAWNGEYQKAEEELKAIIERGPRYQDAYNAMLDMYWWSDQPKKARELAKKAKSNVGEDEEFQKNIKIAMNRFDKSI